MGDFLRIILDSIQYLWPFRPVEAWERGAYFVLNRPRWRVGPGYWPMVPYFSDVKAVSVAPAIIRTPLQIVTLVSGKTLAFSASATVQVEDVVSALVDVDSYEETTGELISGALAERLAKVDPERFETAVRRRNLLQELASDLDEECLAFGVRVRALRFNNFAINLKTYRLLTDSATLLEKVW